MEIGVRCNVRPAQVCSINTLIKVYVDYIYYDDLLEVTEVTPFFERQSIIW